MDDFNRKYYKTCTSIVFPYGFRRYKRVFGRVVNDVYQSFDIEKLGRQSAGKIVRVGFGVVPLCEKLQENWLESGVGLYYLKQFELIPFYGPDYTSDYDITNWYYQPEPESIDVCVAEIMRYLTTYLLPLFERADSCATALQALIEVERLFERNRLAKVWMEGDTPKVYPNGGVNIFDSSKYYMALKSGDYAYALKSCRALEMNNKRAYQSGCENGWLSDENWISRAKEIAQWEEDRIHLEMGDTKYFQAILTENEAYSRDILKLFWKQ